MPVEHGKVGSDKSCSDNNVFEFSVGEEEGGTSSSGVGVVTFFDNALEGSFNFSDDLLTALRWDMGERGAVVCSDDRARRLRNLLLFLLSFGF